MSTGLSRGVGRGQDCWKGGAQGTVFAAQYTSRMEEICG